MTYRDSTDDGFEGETLETGQDPTDFELVGEAERIFRRLMFLSTWRSCEDRRRGLLGVRRGIQGF